MARHLDLCLGRQGQWPNCKKHKHPKARRRQTCETTWSNVNGNRPRKIPSALEPFRNLPGSLRDQLRPSCCQEESSDACLATKSHSPEHVKIWLVAIFGKACGMFPATIYVCDPRRPWRRHVITDAQQQQDKPRAATTSNNKPLLTRMQGRGKNKSFCSQTAAGSTQK